MSLGYGLTLAAAQLGVDAILVKPRRAIGPFTAHVTISERHVDELDITDHPVEAGAQISDHAYKRPPEVTIDCAWSDTPQSGNFLQGLANAVSGTVAGAQAILTGNSPSQVRDVYSKLLALQASATLIDVYTGKRSYRDMLVRQLIVETDKETEHVLRVTATLRQVLIATARVVSLSSAPAEDMLSPEATLSPIDRGLKRLTDAPRSFNLRAAVDALTPTGLEGLL